MAYVPFGLAAIKGIKGVLGASNSPKNGIQGVNDVLGDTQKTITKAGNCFVAGTEILTVDGVKNIEDIQVGDWVIADDPTTPRGIEAKQVLETFIRETDALVDLYVDGEVISTTGEHPFWVPDKGWIEAKDLEVGSLLQTEDGRIIDVDRIERREGDFTTYNFKVEGFHTYYVSRLGILVHNADCGDVAKSYQDDLGGGRRIRISSKDGGFLQDPRDSGWFMHEVFAKKGVVYDPMGMGNVGGIDISARGDIGWQELDRFDPNPTKWSEWLEAYGGRDRLTIERVRD